MFVGIALLIVSLSACGKSVEQRITEQLELGQKYLTEVQYEEALIAFQKVIELEPKTYEAYMGIAQVYEGQEQYEAMQEILEVGIEAIGVEELNEEETQQLVESYMRLTEYFMAEGEYEAELNCYEQILVLQPENEGIREKEENLRLIFENKDRIKSLVFSLIEEKTDDYKVIEYLCNEITERSADLIEDPTIFKLEQENYIVIYPWDTVIIYYGEMERGLRQGHGYRIFINAGQCEIYEGTWEGGVANGEFVYEFYHSDTTYRCKEGKVVAGLYEGNWVFAKKDHEYQINYKQGKLEPIEDLGNGLIVIGYCNKHEKCELLTSRNDFIHRVP